MGWYQRESGESTDVVRVRVFIDHWDFARAWRREYNRITSEGGGRPEAGASSDHRDEDVAQSQEVKWDKLHNTIIKHLNTMKYIGDSEKEIKGIDVYATVRKNRENETRRRKNRTDSRRTNEEIDDEEVRVIDQFGTKLGLRPTVVAIAEAASVLCDLIEVNPNNDPPVCKYVSKQDGPSDRASADHQDDGPDKSDFERWLDEELDPIPGFQVHEFSIITKVEARRCGECKNSIGKSEVVKGLNTQIACDMLSQAVRDSYDIGVIMMSDPELVPSVVCVQEIFDKQIIHIGPRSEGDALRSAAWGHLMFENLVPSLMSEYYASDQ